MMAEEAETESVDLDDEGVSSSVTDEQQVACRNVWQSSCSAPSTELATEEDSLSCVSFESLIHGDSTGAPNFDKIARLYSKYSIQCAELERLEKQNADYRDSLLKKIHENDELTAELKTVKETHENETQQQKRQCLEAEYQLKTVRDRMAASETHAKRTYQETCEKYNRQIEQLKKSSSTAQTEKDAAVIKYAQREAELLKLKSTNQELQEQVKAVTTERDALQAGLRGTKNKEHAVKQNLELKADEVNELHKEIERQKALVAECEIKAKMATQKAAEVDVQNKRTETELISTLKRLNQAQEEARTIKADYQRMFEELQQVDSAKQNELQSQLRERMDQQEIYDVIVKEHDDLKKQHRTALLEINEFKMKQNEIEKRLELCQTELDSERSIKEELSAELVALRPVVQEVTSSKTLAAEACEKEAVAREDEEQARKEALACRLEAEKMLTLTQQLTADNSQLHALNDTIQAKLCSQNVELVNLNEQVAELSKRLNELEHDYGSLQASTSSELQSLHQQVQQQISKEQQLMTSLDDERNQNKVLRKKHASSLKELRTELSTMKRRLASYESSGGGGVPHDKAGAGVSRASSVTSLERSQQSNGLTHNKSSDCESVRSGSNEPTATVAESMVSSASAANQQAMVEKICRLQRQLARRTEKIEFLEEHVKQLTGELRKKTKVMQSFIVREESGAAAPSQIDLNKWEELLEQAEISQHGASTMAALFHGKNEGKLSAEMAMQINSKLQAVLEDALYKNITLKDNLETMGTEIARLSRQNRDLQLTGAQLSDAPS